MIYKTVNPIDTSTDSKETIESLKQLNLEATKRINQDLSFMSLLESSINSSPLIYGYAVKSMDNSSQLSSVESPEAKETTAKKEKKSQELSEAERENSARNSKTHMSADFTTDSTAKDIKDTSDLWTMELKQLSASDLRMILNFMQTTVGAPVGSSSGSLTEHLSGISYRSLDLSVEMQKMLEKAYKTQRPLRIDLSESASVILRFGKDGRLSAEFIPHDKVADIFLKQHLAELKNRLELKQLPYGELSVRQWKEKQNREKENRQ